jgi:hypothetical protein
VLHGFIVFLLFEDILGGAQRESNGILLLLEILLELVLGDQLGVDRVLV